ncbi:MAG: aminopeptidase P family protein [Bacteroidaceae bacterium]|nr:aminopeptidase P family protein [Bacteroidaceae bacterium]
MTKVGKLRQYMRRHGVQAFVTPSTDPHSGEYVPKHWESRAWVTGFTGSAGVAVVTMDKAALWTDSRYFIQAADQIRDTEFVLMKDKVEGTPTIEDWLATELSDGDCVGVDGLVNTVSAIEALRDSLLPYGITVEDVGDPYDEIWEERPQLPTSPVVIQGLEYSGESAASKLARIREKTGMDALLVSMLDEVCWTLNLRGDDIDYNPVFVSYLLITPDKAVLYVDRRKTDEVRSCYEGRDMLIADYLNDEGVEVKDYGSIFSDLKDIDTPVWAQKERTNYACYMLLKNPMARECPISAMKVMKNATEIAGYRKAMVKDGVAMVKWLKWLIPAVEAGGQTEMSLVRRLYELRKEQLLFMGDSFQNIMGYGSHGAIVHYEPNDTTDIPVRAEGLLLCDVGSQYRDGTTDMTRTIPLGPLTDEMRRDYTLVLRGWINLAKAHFPKGTYGSQLDVLARAAMWEYGINYLHGTGHGVGSYLNCHEGPHQFRMNYMPFPLCPSMTITDEPGIYIEGSHGVRHENTMLVVEDKDGVTFGPYYRFEPLTMCPVITWPVITEWLTSDEKTWLNQYQKQVFETLSPLLDNEHREWLREICKEI